VRDINIGALKNLAFLAANGIVLAQYHKEAFPMSTQHDLLSQRQNLIQQIEQLPPMRIGTIRKQMLPRKHKDGTITRRGPYWTFTYSKNGKNFAKHIASDREAEIYNAQIESRRRFRDLCAQLLEVSQKMADLELLQDQGKKNSAT